MKSIIHIDVRSKLTTIAKFQAFETLVNIHIRATPEHALFIAHFFTSLQCLFAVIIIMNTVFLQL